MGAILNSTSQAKPKLNSTKQNAFYNSELIWPITPPPNYFRVINAATIVPVWDYSTLAMQYSLNNGASWTSISTGVTITTGGATCLLRGTGGSRLFNNITATSRWQVTQYDYRGISLAGDPRTLLNWPTLQKPDSRAFANMFRGQADITDISNLIIPPSDQVECYYRMFGNCSNLGNQPQMRITTFTTNMCAYMFQNCTSLNALPLFRGTFYYGDSCAYMYDGCSSLDVYMTSGAGHQQIFRIPQTGSSLPISGAPFTNMFRNISPGSDAPATLVRYTDYYVRYIPV